MTTDESIVFYCTFCGQKIAIHHDASGYTVACPVCKNNVTVPKSHTYTITGPACLKSDTALMEALAASADETVAPDPPAPPPAGEESKFKKRTRRILFPRRREEPAEDQRPSSSVGEQVLKGSTTLLMETINEHDTPPPIAPIKLRIPPKSTNLPPAPVPPRPPAKNGGKHVFSMILAGCVCLLIGIVGSFVRPELFPVLSAFFLVGIVVGLFCLAEKHPLWGIGLLLTSAITFLGLIPGSPAGKGPSVQPARNKVATRPAPTVTPAPPAVAPTEAPPTPLEVRQAAPAPEHAPLWFSAPSAPETVPAEQPAAPAVAQEKPAVTPAPSPEAGKESATGQAKSPATGTESPITVNVESQESAAPVAVAEPLREAIKVDLPFSVYDDCNNEGGTQQFIPSGWMGRLTAIEFDDCCAVEPHGGRTCVRMAYTATNGWGAVAWQESENNWGKWPGGYDVTGAKVLSFWAKAQDKDTSAIFKIGVVGSGKYADTAHVATKKIRLTTDWRQYELPLSGQNLSRVMSGFVCVIEGAKTPQVVYLDDIEFR